MEVGKIVLHSILEIFHFILASSILHIDISVPFHSIFDSIPYHALPTVLLINSFLWMHIVFFFCFMAKHTKPWQGHKAGDPLLKKYSAAAAIRQKNQRTAAYRY